MAASQKVQSHHLQAPESGFRIWLRNGGSFLARIPAAACPFSLMPTFALHHLYTGAAHPVKNKSLTLFIARRSGTTFAFLDNPPELIRGERVPLGSLAEESTPKTSRELRRFGYLPCCKTYPLSNVDPKQYFNAIV